MHAEWRARIEKETGRTPEQLARPLAGGIPVDPLSTDLPPGVGPARPGEWPYARGSVPTPVALRACPRIDSARSDAIRIVEEAAALGARAFWVDGPVSAELAAAVARLDGEILDGADPLGDLVRSGPGPSPLEQRVAEAVRDAARAGGAPLVASGLPYDEGGADPALQLALVAATGVFYLRRLEETGVAARDAADRIVFRLAVGADVVAGIALLRAARIVWGRVRVAGGLDGSIALLHAVSSARELTRRDPWVNMLRGTSHAFAALAGGADRITVLPFDEPVRIPEHAARRLALNTLTILRDECFVGAVTDPGGGSWAIEHLTDRIARAAWDGLRAIETHGGMVEALLSGEVRRLVDEAWAARARDLATRRAPLTGVSEFADPAEASLAGETVPAGPAPGPDFPFPRHRDDDAYHALRSITDDLAAGSGRPAVFLANLGPAAEHRARTGFAISFFRAGGFDVVESASAGDVPPADAARALAGAFRASGAPVACLCGSDERYEGAAAQAAEALREAGAVTLLLAGRPDGRESLADDFAYLGCDVPAVLGGLLEQLAATRGAR